MVHRPNPSSLSSSPGPWENRSLLLGLKFPSWPSQNTSGLLFLSLQGLNPPNVLRLPLILAFNSDLLESTYSFPLPCTSDSGIFCFFCLSGIIKALCTEFFSLHHPWTFLIWLWSFSTNQHCYIRSHGPNSYRGFSLALEERSPVTKGNNFTIKNWPVKPLTG